mmetsp:Transcript_57430/g.136515  ORF Transcript_57430/g.136515 Transcript_57430/m.136515 type:complete len:357 (-) Transcript_57430:153-1223(-)|eukprot:CAMPEP_0178427788 /NCGR_PEP_ID=MMETSP0689_2-20121128/29926_1 /TAXON_ID=160604 /ORGANISM="Amphidinium massartii, Strain CS-259" /LENGTH=356 /DNA_ID=CAMNT_0020049507 /DNA_START=86 /DNA_END=1156 /DNA_ORIENTATION=+
MKDNGGRGARNARQGRGPPNDGRQPAVVDEEKSQGNADGGGQMTAPPLPALSQLEIDQNELIVYEKVGEGVTAEVFRGEYRGDMVAIKEIGHKNKTSMSVKEQVLLAREVSINARVSYDYLVKFFGVSFSSKFRIITEFCSGGTCFELFHNRKHVSLTWAQRHKIMSDVACGMNYLHEFSPQIIHRDLKSLNLLLTNAIVEESEIPHVKVSDFGLARMKDSSELDGWVKMTPATGTCHWMAPEVFGSNYDVRVDVYSYAMVLFEAICRRVPFQEVEAAVVERYTKQGIRPGLGSVPADCPKQLVELMVACWAQKADERPMFGHIIGVLNSVSLGQGFGKALARQASFKSSRAVLSL